MLNIQAVEKQIIKGSGILTGEQCQHICQQASISIEALMIELLPIAASYAVAPISKFYVGAVARGKENLQGMANLYIGANIEFTGEALCHSLHAEQSVISNAWLHGETAISALAISAPPCGHCRQFLYEVSGTNNLDILLPRDSYTGLEAATSNADDSFDVIHLTSMLPGAFGPIDLGCKKLMMQAQHLQGESLQLDEHQQSDNLISEALGTANSSYAPYSGNQAGIALLLTSEQMTSGQIVLGRYAENAAFNPSLAPFIAAFSQYLLLKKQDESLTIQRAVLVEKATLSSQKNTTTTLLSATTDNVTLEYIRCT